MSSPEPDRGDPAILRRVLAREALDARDAATALRWIDELPPSEQPDWLAEVWMLAGSRRALMPLLPTLGPAMRARVDGHLADPPRRPLPPAPPTADPYLTLQSDAERLAALGLAADLAMTHLSLADLSPRADWRVVHIEHAASLAFGLGDARLSALCRAYEARRDAELGEHEDALEAAQAALEQGLAADEPRAVAIAEAIAASLADVTKDRASEPEDL